jgi:hypothetical protein
MSSQRNCSMIEETPPKTTSARDVRSGNKNAFRTVSGDCKPISTRLGQTLLSTSGGARECARDYLAGEKEVGAKNELSIFATIGPAASLVFLTATHSGSTTNLPHLASRSAKLSQTSM